LPQGLTSVHQVNFPGSSSPTAHADLVELLRDQDAVIVFTRFAPGHFLAQKSLALIDAAIEAGVKYFLPSEWAMDTAGVMGSTEGLYGPTLPTDMVLASKRVSRITYKHFLGMFANEGICIAGSS
jgi:hypothetical protein